MTDRSEGSVQPERGADLLDAVEMFVSRFVSFPSPAALVAFVLWVAHTHAVQLFDSSPRLALLSPEPGSGKTRALEVAELLAPRPMHVLSASPAAIFRSIEAQRPTLLFDEVDAIFGRHGKGDDGSEDLRALLNAGHRAGATIPRCHGPAHEVRMFPVYGAAALAGLGDLPDTLMSRAVVIRMRRRAPGEKVEPFRRRIAAPEGLELANRLDHWAEWVADDLHDAWPEMPEGVTDRPADVWEALLAIADAAAGSWPSRARAACVELCKVNVSREASLGVRLLTDLRAVFDDRDRMSTEAVLSALHDLEEAPWSDLRGRPIDARGLARRLTQYGIGSAKVRVGEASVRGYRREDLWDAWQRYCAPTPEEAEQAEQPPQPQQAQASAVPFDLACSGTVPEQDHHPEHDRPCQSGDVPDVPDVPDSEHPEGVDPDEDPPDDVPEWKLDLAPEPERPTEADLARWEAIDLTGPEGEAA